MGPHQPQSSGSTAPSPRHSQVPTYASTTTIGKTDITKATDRPLPGLLNAILEAAHQRHDNRKLLHPPTDAYSLFQWRVADSSSGGASATWSLGGGISIPDPTAAVPPATGTAAYATSLPGSHSAYHSSMTLHHVPSSAAISSPGVAVDERMPLGTTAAGSLTSAPSPAHGPRNVSRPEAAMGFAYGANSLNTSGGGAADCSAFKGEHTGASGGLYGPFQASRSTGGAPGSAALHGSGSDGGDGRCVGPEASRVSTRSRPRPAVVERALTAWEGSELEVVCLYDSNFQTANVRGQHGPPRRVAAPVHIGPVSYLYRWYCKRATQFRDAPAPGDIPGAPAMPPPDEPWGSRTDGSSAPGKARGAAVPGTSQGTSTSISVSTRHAGRTGSAPRTPRPGSTSRGARGGSGGSGSGIGGIGRGAAGGSSSSSSSPSGGVTSRRLNLAADPVMSLSEVVDMLEDLEVVPQLASRTDVAQLFAAACKSAAAAGVPSAGPYGTAPAHAPASAPSTPRGQSGAPRPTAPAPPRSSSRDGAKGGGGDAPNTHSGTTPPASSRSSRASSASTNVSLKSTREGAISLAAAAAVAAVAANAGAGAGVSVCGPSIVPRPQVHPEEIRFPAFKDFLIRLALAIAAASSSTNSGGTTKGGASSTPSTPRPGSSAPCGGAASCWAPALSSDDAAAAIGRLLGHMRLHRSDVRGLKHRLDSLARTAADHGARMAGNRLLYLAGPSLLPAAAGVAVAAAPPPPPGRGVRPPPEVGAFPVAAGATAGTAYAAPPPWGVLAAAPVPAYLQGILDDEDRDDREGYRPAWREFGSVALELGVLAPGELRQCRLMLHNRGPHTLSVRLDGRGAPFCRCAHMGLASLPPGMPRHVDIAVQLPYGEYTAGQELVGELRLCYSSSQDRREQDVVVPVYGVVSGQRSGSPITGRKVPMARSERVAVAAKATREPVAKAVATAAAAAAPLRHCGPRRVLSCQGSSMVLAGSTGTGGEASWAPRLSSTGGAGLQSQGSLRLAWAVPTATRVR